jgi:hypothetical protein
VQKPAVLTTFGQSVNNINIYQYIRDLTPATGGQKNPAENGQGHRLFQLLINSKAAIYCNKLSVVPELLYFIKLL